MKRNLIATFDSIEQAEQAEREYWWSKTAAYRLRALERFLPAAYGRRVALDRWWLAR